MRLRERAFARALSDLRVRGTLIAASEPLRVPASDACRCCCYPTVTRTTYDSCPICRRFDDVIEDPDPEDARATANDYPLNAARRNFIDWRALYGPSDEGYAAATRRASERGPLIEGVRRALAGRPSLDIHCSVAPTRCAPIRPQRTQAQKARPARQPGQRRTHSRVSGTRDPPRTAIPRDAAFCLSTGSADHERRSLEVFTTIADGAVACVEAELGPRSI